MGVSTEAAQDTSMTHTSEITRQGGFEGSGKGLNTEKGVFGSYRQMLAYGGRGVTSPTQNSDHRLLILSRAVAGKR